jgi:Cu-processing system permease protein
MSAILVLAGKEIREATRNRWVLAATLLLALLALALAFLGSAPTGDVAAGRLTVTVVSLASLGIYLLPLIALLLSFDTVVGEAEQGTLLLLLAYPVSRSTVMAGKFLGHAAVLAFATVVGFGLAAGVIAVTSPPSPEEWLSFALLVGASVGLGWSFIAIGFLISVLVTERASAAGLAGGVWLVLVVLYDMGLMGALVATGGQGWISDALPALLMLNPADAYRLLNLTVMDQAARMAGLQDVAATVPPALAAAALALWVAAPLALTSWVFSRREL